MSARFELLHHSHSGKIRPHEHTSYGLMGILLLCVGIVLTTVSMNVSGASPGPEAGSIGLNGIVPGKPPTQAATIDVPSNGQHFAATPITVSGTCPPNTIVELFKNDIFAGSTSCSTTSKYSMEIDLLFGKNDLIARVYDSLNQAGPKSNMVTVYYDALPTQAGPVASFDFGGAQLLINTDAVFRGVFPEKTMVMPIDIIGGRPPYAVNVQWGDSSNKIVPRSDNIGFNVDHIYKKPGVFQIGIQASDADGRVAFLTVAAIVNGQPDIAAAANKPSSNQLLMLWPLYTAAATALLSFWLGEKREKHVLKVKGYLTST